MFALRLRAAHLLVAFIWLLVALTAGVGWITGENELVGCLISGFGALVASLVVSRDPLAAISPLFIATAMMTAVSVLVWMVPPWLRVDLHMLYFAGLALLAGLCSVEAIWLAAGLIAAHHLILSFLLPSAVFPETASGNVSRVALHAVIVLLEAGMLAWMISRLKTARTVTARALDEAGSSARRVESEIGLRRETEARASRDALSGRHALADQIEEGLGSVVIAVSEAVAELECRSRLLSSDTQMAAAESHRAAGAATDVAQSIQAVAAASEQLSAAGEGIGFLIGDAVVVIAQAVERVRAADATLLEMTEGANNVASVVELVAGIANQTKLLALNATIEAARAGHAGQGFAVVAGEVKALALQTRKATDEIGRHVAEMRAATGVAVGAMQDIDRIFGQVNRAATSIAEAIKEQNSATQDIACSAAQVAERTAAGHDAANRAVTVLATADQSCTAVNLAASLLSVQRHSLQEKLSAATRTLRTA